MQKESARSAVMGNSQFQDNGASPDDKFKAIQTFRATFVTIGYTIYIALYKK